MLVTGFGPFPGVTHNASSLLAAAIADAAEKMWPGVRVKGATLPTEWRRGLELLDTINRDFDPDVALHFGVSERARGLTLERSAYNVCSTDADASGACALLPVLVASGPDELATGIDADQLLQKLTTAGIPSCMSDDPGRYLCNAIYFTSLQRTRARERAALSLFVHIPAQLCVDASGQMAASCPIDWGDAQRGGMLIAEHALEQWANT